MNKYSRRQFLAKSFAAGGVLSLGLLGSCSRTEQFSTQAETSKIQFGLVTYQWGKDWDLPTLIKNCESADVLGVELRTEHAHGVKDSMTTAQRQQVKKTFADSAVTLVGLGMNFDFHHTDQARVRANIEGAKSYIVLSRDVGGSGIKVKPNNLPADVPAEKTIEQIGRSLNELGKFAQDYGQQIRVEVHGKRTQNLEVMKKIMDVADNRNVAVCWNSNQKDLVGKGLEYNFDLVKNRLGDTVHVREFDKGDYPYQRLINLFVKNNYKGWILLEAHSFPPLADRIVGLSRQKLIFDKMVAAARS
jgi:sugar phosphate isomerase/epimerase